MSPKTNKPLIRVFIHDNSLRTSSWVTVCQSISAHATYTNLPTQTAYARLLSHIGVSFSWKIRVPLAEGKLYSKFTYEILWIWLLTNIYLGTPKGRNFSLKRKNKLLGSQTEISVWGWSQAICWFSGWFVWISTWFWKEIRLKPGKNSRTTWSSRCLPYPVLVW